MRTTLDINDELMKQAKSYAAKSGLTLTALLENALKEKLRSTKRQKSSYRLQWKTVKGQLQPGVDLSNRDSLFDLMNDPSIT